MCDNNWHSLILILFLKKRYASFEFKFWCSSHIEAIEISPERWNGRLEVYLHLVSERHEKAHRAEFSLKFRILILELYRFELTVYPNYLKTDHQLVHHGEHFGKLNWKFRMKNKNLILYELYKCRTCYDRNDKILLVIDSVCSIYRNFQKGSISRRKWHQMMMNTGYLLVRGLFGWRLRVE